MRNTYGNTNEKLRKLAGQASGLHYDSPEAGAILDARGTDWSSHWPVADGNGLLTGDVVETDDCEGYANLGDVAMVALDDLTPEQISANGGLQSIRENGYVALRIPS